MKTPTPSAIDTAIRNADRDAAKYEVEYFAANCWFVTRKGDLTRMYWVDATERTCDCPAFERSGCCKHQKMVDDVIEIEREAAEFEVRAEAEAFMNYTARDHAAAMLTGGGEYL